MLVIQRTLVFIVVLIVVILGSSRVIHYFQMSQVSSAIRLRSVEFEVFGKVQGINYKPDTTNGGDWRTIESSDI